MKSIFAVFLFSVFASVAAFGQNKDISAVEKALETLRVQMLNPTESGLKSISHPALTYGHSSGKIENQKEFMEAFLTGASDFTSLDFSDVKIEIVGKTAVVRHILTAESMDKGKQPAKVNIKVMLVFTKEKASWVLLGRQAVKYL
ncbi:nuclear transport factor 2 family protein [Lacihabitans soyangensis]|uniref:Nuclear transport factor 2 family protein n=1 Tax=Lacihabitans soyangensis TaxID=869394 RepID=A0AAE3KWM0_9BACT|nr:nuclear transport factor 2 family protein [Lacihabitans soyangensis]MCP9765951.1 nuclear transport factor 2 family protein [Lacihabitans soyangensis]